MSIEPLSNQDIYVIFGHDRSMQQYQHRPRDGKVQAHALIFTCACIVLHSTKGAGCRQCLIRHSNHTSHPLLPDQRISFSGSARSGRVVFGGTKRSKPWQKAFKTTRYCISHGHFEKVEDIKIIRSKGRGALRYVYYEVGPFELGFHDF
jgi:hypothetical protein